MLYLQENSHDAARHQRWLGTARAYGPDAILLDRAQALHYLPESPRSWTGALYSASDGAAEPGMATQGIAGLAMRHGAAVFEHCAVRGLDVQAGRVAGVITERGPVRSQVVLLAGGADRKSTRLNSSH